MGVGGDGTSRIFDHKPVNIAFLPFFFFVSCFVVTVKPLGGDRVCIFGRVGNIPVNAYVDNIPDKLCLLAWLKYRRKNKENCLGLLLSQKLSNA